MGLIFIVLEWVDFEREPQHPPNPDYPKGIVVDCAPDKFIKYLIPLPYPAPRCGAYTARCTVCNVKLGCTTAGRPDDPCTMKFSCKCFDNGMPDNIVVSKVTKRTYF